MFSHKLVMKVVINPKYRCLEEFVKAIPELFSEEGTVIYDARNTLKVFEVQGISVCVKSFHIPFFLNQVVYGYCRSSKAQRSYDHGLVLLEKGINTPEPVAYIEHKKAGLLYDSYYISINQPYTGMMRELRTGRMETRIDLLRSFARFAASVHEKDILHKDFSPGNILYQKEPDGGYSFFLVDINRISFQKITMELGCENLQRLWGSQEMILFIAREYAKARGFDPEACAQLTWKYHTIFWKRFSKRHDGALPYID